MTEQSENSNKKTTELKLDNTAEPVVDAPTDDFEFDSEVIPPVKKTKTKQSNFIAWLALFIALIASAACAWLYWQSLQRSGNLIEQQQQLEQTLTNSINNRQQSLNSDLSRQLDGYKAAINSDLDKQLNQFSKSIQQNLNSQKQEIQQAIEQISTAQISSRDQAILIDIRYLLTLASRKFYIEEDKTGTIEILTLAQNKLAERNNSQWFVLRNKISDDLSKVKAIKEIDVEGVFLQLTELMGQMIQLPLRQVNLTQQTDQPLQLQQPSEEISMSNLEIIWHDFLSLFIPKQRKGNVEPLLTPSQEQNIKQNLMSKLNQAQWAALRAKSTIYQSALKQSAEWIEQYYEKDNAQVNHVLTQLNHLQTQNLTQDFSQINLESITALEALISTTAKTNENAEVVAP